MYQKEVTETQKRLSMIILERSGKEENVYPNLLDREGLQLNGEEFEKKNSDSILQAFASLPVHLSNFLLHNFTSNSKQKTKNKKNPQKTQTKNNNNTGNPKDRQKRPHPF